MFFPSEHVENRDLEEEEGLRRRSSSMKFGYKILFCFLVASLALPAQEPQDRQAQDKQPSPAPATSAEEAALRKAVGAPVDPNTYMIGPEDILMIKVWREPELSGPVGVRPDGKISLPLIGDVQAGGTTPTKLAKEITDGFSKYVNNPEVMVQVASVNSKKYFITGEVNHPGSFPLVVPTTVLEALAIAGGFRDFAKKKDVLILRGPKRYKFNYKEVIKGKNMAQNIQLENGDHIIVP
jgi:polysaccharide export outer membrane protein